MDLASKAQSTENFGSKYASQIPLVLGVCVVVVALLIGYFLAYKVFYLSYESNLAVAAEKQKDLDELTNKVSQLSKAKNLGGSLEESNKVALEGIPEEEDVPVVMTMVQTIVEDSGLNIKAFSYAGSRPSGLAAVVAPVVAAPKTTTETPPSTPVISDAFDMNLTVTGKFSSIQRLMRRLENSRRLMSASNFSYQLKSNPNQTSSFSDEITLKILLSAYFRSYKDLPSNIDLDKYLPTLEKLRSMTYTEVDLSNVNVGKKDPFSEGSESSSATEDTSINVVDFSNQGNSPFESNSTSNSNVQNGGAPNNNTSTGNSSSTTTQEDVEADPGNTNQILLNLIQQESSSGGQVSN